MAKEKPASKSTLGAVTGGLTLALGIGLIPLHRGDMDLKEYEAKVPLIIKQLQQKPSIQKLAEEFVLIHPGELSEALGSGGAIIIIPKSGKEKELSANSEKIVETLNASLKSNKIAARIKDYNTIKFDPIYVKGLTTRFPRETTILRLVGGKMKKNTFQLSEENHYWETGQKRLEQIQKEYTRPPIRIPPHINPHTVGKLNHNNFPNQIPFTAQNLRRPRDAMARRVKRRR